jgi:branched-chain amino acid transport system permease protein
MTYRMSRMVAFVNGGIGTFAAFLYWWLAQDPNNTSGVATGGLAYATKEWPTGIALLTVVLFGSVVGTLFGSLVTGRMRGWPRTTVTTFALGGMLLFGGVAGTLWKGVFERVPTPFSNRNFEMWGAVVRWHQAAVFFVLVILVLGLTFTLQKTRLGTYIRAIADDPETAEYVGIPVERVSLLIWAFSGGLAAFAGAMIVPMTLLTELTVVFVLLRSLAAAVLGGVESLWLGLAGAMLVGMIESVVGSGVFGPMSSGKREMILIDILFGSIVLMSLKNRTRSAALMEG